MITLACAKLLYEHSVSLFFIDNHRLYLSPVSFFWKISTPMNLCKGQKHSAARIIDDDFRGCSLLVMLEPLSMSTRLVFYLFSTTTDPFWAQFRFSRPNQYPQTYAEADNVPQRKSAMTISEAGLLTSCHAAVLQHEHSVSLVSRQPPTAFEPRFEFSGPMQHCWSPTKAKKVPLHE